MRKTISIPIVEAICDGCGHLATCGDFTKQNGGTPLHVCESCITQTIGIHPDVATERNLREDPR